MYKEPVEFLLRSACHSLYSIKNPSIEQKVVVANGFTEVFSYFATAQTYAGLITILTWFTKETELYLPLFTELSTADLDIELWLKTASTNLFWSLKKANIIDSSQSKQREIYLQLTRILVFFVNAEIQRMNHLKSIKCALNESIRFLDQCTQSKLFLESDPQYIDCFKLLNEFLSFIRLNKSNELGESFQNFMNRFKYETT